MSDFKFFNRQFVIPISNGFPENTFFNFLVGNIFCDC